jgi:hypothetical protein
MDPAGKREAWVASEGKPVPDSVDPGNWHGGNMNYFESLLAVDDSVGRVIQTLREQGQLENTMVIFTSDNGFFLGRHHRGDKRLAYESSMRIPMLVHYPPMTEPGETVEPMTLNIDVAPTLLDLAGLSRPEAMQGRSFLPLLEGERPSDWRDAFFYAYYQENWWPGIPTLHAVRTRQWKYITAPNKPDQVDELYDLVTDPLELDNLAQEPAHADKLKAMRSRLAQLKERTGYLSREQAMTRRLRKTPVRVMLAYGEAGIGDQQLLDASGGGQHAQWNRAQVQDGPHGQALVFEGNSAARFNPGPDDVNPGRKPLAVGAWIKPASGSGVVYAQGGQTHGLSLYLEDGVPHFATRDGGSLHQVAGSQALANGQWHHVVGRLTAERELLLLVDGEVVATAKGAAVQRQPNDGVTIGADTGSRVTDHDQPLHYAGQIADLRVYQGPVDDQTLQQWASP